MNPIKIERGGKTVTISNESERDLLLAELVNEEIQAGRNFADAWGIVQVRCPQLFSGMKSPKVRMPYRQKPATFFNSGPAPAFGPQLRLIFRLPADAAQAVCSAAWRANGGTAESINFKKVFSGLVDFIAKERSVGRTGAESIARVEFPELAEAVKTVEEATRS